MEPCELFDRIHDLPGDFNLTLIAVKAGIRIIDARPLADQLKADGYLIDGQNPIYYRINPAHYYKPCSHCSKPIPADQWQPPCYFDYPCIPCTQAAEQEATS